MNIRFHRSIILVLSLFLFLCFSNVYGAQYYIQFKNGSAITSIVSSLTLPEPGGSVNPPTVSIVSGSTDNWDNNSWYCKDGSYYVRLGVQEHDKSTPLTDGNQDNIPTTTTGVPSWTFTKLIWEDIPWALQQNPISVLGDFTMNGLPDTSPCGDCLRWFLFICLERVPCGTCCGDDDYNITNLKMGYSHRLWCVRNAEACNSYSGIGTEVCIKQNVTYSQAFYNYNYDGFFGWTRHDYYPGYSISASPVTNYFYTTGYCPPDAANYLITNPAGDKICNCTYDIENKTFLDDPDVGPSACQSCALRNDPGKRAWNSSADMNRQARLGYQCCGDDAKGWDDNSDDCYYSDAQLKNRICIKNGSTNRWYWEIADYFPGEVYSNIVCTPQYRILSNGSSWLKCNRNYLVKTDTSTTVPNPYTFLGHDYICFNTLENPAGYIYECCGSTKTNCYSPNSESKQYSDGTYNTWVIKEGTSFLCSTTGQWIREGSDDASQFMCQTNKYNWSLNVIPSAEYCCGDDHNGYYDVSDIDDDDDGIISDCMNFTNNLNTKNNKVCLQLSGDLDGTSVELSNPGDWRQNSTVPCSLQDWLAGITQTACCWSPSTGRPCYCRAEFCNVQEEGCTNPEQPSWKCYPLGVTIPIYPPFAMKDTQDDSDAKWFWANSSRAPGLIYQVSCAGYPFVSEKTATDARWISCTNYTVNNIENGFYLHQYSYSNGKPVIAGVNDNHKASLYLPNPYNITGPSGASHGYLCYNTTQGVEQYPLPYSLKECCDKTASFPRPGYCNSRSLGSYAQPGDYIRYFNNQQPTKYYCTTNYTWTRDLDYVYGEGVIELPGANCNLVHAKDPTVVWTGTKCCGDADDYPEYYSDSGSTTGACWNSTLADNLDYLRDATNQPYYNVFVYNGVFQGCRLQTTPLNSYIDNPITNREYCYTIDILSGDNLFCNPVNGNWNPIPQPLDQNTFFDYKPAVDYDPYNFGCCTKYQCWDKDKGECVNSFDLSTPPVISGGQEYRCFDGEWTGSISLYSWDRRARGYCMTNGSCFVSNKGIPTHDNDTFYYDYDLGKRVNEWWNSNKAPVCINNGSYIADNYCENGNWTSRTRFIATQLLNYANQEASNNYTLFCEDVTDTLTLTRPKSVNKLDYTVDFLGSAYIKKFLDASCELWNNNTGEWVAGGVLCVNKICILKYNDNSYGEHIVVGISLNVPINQTPSSSHKSFFYALGIESNTLCDNVLHSTSFTSCNPSAPANFRNTVFYNGKLQSVIFSKFPLSNFGTSAITTESGWKNYFTMFLKSPADTLIDSLFSKYPLVSTAGHVFELEYMLNTSRFNRLFIDVKPDGRKIFAINEKIRMQYDDRSDSRWWDEYMAINYTGFDANICKTIQRFNLREDDRTEFYDKIQASDGLNEINCSTSCSGGICSYYAVSRRSSIILDGSEIMGAGPYVNRYKWIGDDMWDELTQGLRVQD